MGVTHAASSGKTKISPNLVVLPNQKTKLVSQNPSLHQDKTVGTTLENTCTHVCKLFFRQRIGPESYPSSVENYEQAMNAVARTKR